jgi:hypothetical protein
MDNVAVQKSKERILNLYHVLPNSILAYLQLVGAAGNILF